jgi:ribosomal protein L7/L12
MVNESFLLGLVAAGVIASAIILQLLSRDRRQTRTMSRLEGKLDALLKHEGVQFNPYADVAPAVLDALSRGKKINAIKEYRAATGAGLQEAKDYVEELQRRASLR